MPSARSGRRSNSLLAALVAATATAWSVYVWYGVVRSPPPVCVTGLVDAHYEKAIAALDGNVDLGLKLSTALLGGGGALLIGLKEGMRQTLWTRLSLVVALLFFAQSALYGLWWRIGIAEGWIGECLNLVTEVGVAMRFVADMNFFLAGLIALGAFVLFGIASKDDGRVEGAGGPAAPTPAPAVGPVASAMAGAAVALLLDSILRRSKR